MSTTLNDQDKTRETTAALGAGADIAAGVDAPDGGRHRPGLQQAMEDIVESGITGLTVRVHDERGEWVGSAGVAELGRTPKPPIDGYVRIGSNTKTFTAALVLRLVAEDKLGLDVSAAHYLPELGLDERITVRMLLQHTSGVFNFTGEQYPDGTIALGIASAGTPLADEWADHRFRTYLPEELVGLALSKPARFEPGTGWSYSNTNYVIARMLIEKASGRSYSEEMRRLVLAPLGLWGTIAPTTQSELPEPHAHAYYRYDGDQGKTVDVTEQNPSWISSGGDMISTSRDLGAFITALVRGKLLPPELLAEMYKPYPTGIPGMDYGLGVFVKDTGVGGTVITHNGGAAGHAALMYSTLDGSKTLTATLNYVDDSALSLAGPFQAANERLVTEVFCDGRS